LILISTSKSASKMLSTHTSMIRIADIKRGGMAALDAALLKGPAHIMKRNRSAAVVLLPADYEALVKRAALAARPSADEPISALDWMLQEAPPEGTLNADQVVDYVRSLRSDWDERDARFDRGST
jgi:hypothetical protein